MTLDPSAITKIQEILAEENNPAIKLRVFVQGGGCSGMSYGFTLDEQQADDDFDIIYDNVKVLVDALKKGFADRNNILTTLTKFLKVCNKDLVEKKVINESDLETLDSASDFLKSIYRWKLVDEDIITQEE